jgi:hypothetical protein
MQVIDGIEYPYVTVVGGHPARIVCEDRFSDSHLKVALVRRGESEDVFVLTRTFCIAKDGRDPYLELHNEWKDVPVDTPIWVRDEPDESWLKRHFSHFQYSRVYAYTDGCTSHTSRTPPSSWDYASKTDPNKPTS